MIESIENGIQLLLAGICTVIALTSAVRSGRRAWVLLGLFSGSYFLGDLYWLLFLVFYGETPVYSYISNMSWYASFLFLFMLLYQIRERQGQTVGRNPWKPQHRILWIVPVFTAGMCILYMRFGSYASNLIYAVLMTLILLQALDGLLSLKSEQDKGNLRGVYWTTVIFCAAEYGMWTATCFIWVETFAHPYYWFELVVSACFLLFLPAVRKAADR